MIVLRKEIFELMFIIFLGVIKAGKAIKVDRDMKDGKK